MTRFLKSGTAVMISAVLLFMMLFPVPVGASAFDRLRYDRAHANPGAVVLPLTVLGTALALYGVYVAGTSSEDYASNLGDVLVDLADEMGTTVSELEQSLSSAVNSDGNINMGVLAQLGLTGAISNLIAANLGNQVIEGSNSAASNVGIKYFNTVPVMTYSALPVEYELARQNCGNANVNNAFLGFTIATEPTATITKSYIFYFAKSANLTSMGMLVEEGASPRYAYTFQQVARCFVQYKTNGTIRYSSDSYAGWFYERGASGYSSYLNPDFDFTAYNENVTVSDGVVSAYKAVVDHAILQGAVDSPPTDVVEPFEPTAAQLEAGYSNADIVTAINTGNATIDGILSFLQTNFPILSTIANGVSGIASDVASMLSGWTSLQTSPFDWLASWWGTLTGWWNTLLSWLGATPIGQLLSPIANGINSMLEWVGDTPFGTVLGNVLEGVQAIPGALSGAADTVIGGLQGVLEGIGQGVSSIPDTVVGVRDAVLSIPNTIATTLDGLFAGEADMEYTPSGDGLRLREELRAQLEAELDMKAPFCYMRRFQSLAASIAGNFGGEQSFYFDVDIPFAGTQRFDAGMLLNRQWGSLTVAQYLRVLMTATMCAGLLAVSLKIAIGKIGAKE